MMIDESVQFYIFWLRRSDIPEQIPLNNSTPSNFTPPNSESDKSTHYVIASVMLLGFIFVVSGQEYYIWYNARENRQLYTVNLEEEISVQTRFSGMTETEFQKLLMPTMNWDCFGSNNPPEVISDFPDRFDWRDQDMVGPILDQNLCNGCWAFSIVGVMETMLAILRPSNRIRREITRLSIQQAIDCLKVNKGSRKGNVNTALKYMYDTRMKIVTEKVYPLHLVDEECRLDGDTRGVGIKNYTSVCLPGSKFISSVVANHGPVVALVNAMPWKNYAGGIITKGCDGAKESLQHAVQIVGYDWNNDGVPYYIVRNSWGDDFGDHGYVYIAMNNNVCGIESNIFYLNVN